MADDMNRLEYLVQKFEEAEEARTDGADLAARCRDYYDGKQLTEAELVEIRKAKQPPVVINRIRRKIDWLRGLEMQSRTDPKAFPRTPKHEEGAQAATDAIRYVCDKTDLDRKRSQAWECMLIEGIGAVEVIHEDKPSGDTEIVINHYPYDRVFHDPYSRMADFSDARFLGAVIWADAADLKEQFPGKDAEIDASCASSSELNMQFDDIPRWKLWSDKSRKRVRVVLMHYKDGKGWKWAKYVKGGILEQGESPYIDEDGASVCPMLLQSAYIDRENTRYGVVKDMLDPQDEINARRRKLLHSLNTRQTMGIKGAVSSVTKLKAELAKPDGHVEVDADAVTAAAEVGMKPFEILSQNDQIVGQFQLLQHATAEIDLMGANSGLAGKEQGSDSGRAIMARQQGGLIEIAPLTDGLSDFTRRIYRHIWMRIRQFWKAEKWVRVTDEEKNARFVGLNTPVTLREQLSQMPEPQVVAIARQMGLTPNDPRLDMQVGVKNPVDQIDVDILIEEVPDAVTLEGETFQQVVNIATSVPGAVPPDVLIEMAPGLKRDVKDKLLERLKEQQAQQAESGQMQMQAQAQMAQLEAMKTQSEAEKNQSLAAKTNVEAQRLALGY
jgi:hypothetical protein